MAKNKSLTKAKKVGNDEFYTQYSDIQKEMNAYLEYNPDVFKDKTILLPCDDPEWSNFTKFFAQNFEKFGLKKLISTSYANDKKETVLVQLSLFEKKSPQFNKDKTDKHGKVFILEKDNNKSGRIDINDIEWKYLKEDGDFRSDEVKKLRDEADIIITNPPFSLFREFINWIFEGKKDFIIVGNQNAINYKELFPSLMNNSVWTGYNYGSQDFLVPKEFEKNNTYYGSDGNKYAKFGNICWFTNIEHGRRHQPLQLMTMEDNLKYSKHKEIKNKGYCKYQNIEGIEVPYIDAIPSNYKGIMGVPITFMLKYNPNQFKVLGNADIGIVPKEWKGMSKEFVDLYYKQGNTGSIREGNPLACYINHEGLAIIPFKRIIIENIEMEDN